MVELINCGDVDWLVNYLIGLFFGIDKLIHEVLISFFIKIISILVIFLSLQGLNTLVLILIAIGTSA